MNHPQPNYKSKCETCGVYYEGEHECKKILKIKCDVCQMPISFFAGESAYVAMARHKQSVNCISNGAKPVEEKQSNPVNRPAHYNQGGIECIDAIRAALGDDGFRAYCLGNVIKYSWRHAHKNGAQDRQKCAWYARMASGDDPRGEA